MRARTRLARVANFSVLCVSSAWLLPGVTVQTTAMRAPEPVRLGKPQGPEADGNVYVVTAGLSARRVRIRVRFRALRHGAGSAAAVKCEAAAVHQPATSAYHRRVPLAWWARADRQAETPTRSGLHAPTVTRFLCPLAASELVKAWPALAFTFCPLCRVLWTLSPCFSGKLPCCACRSATPL